jgi:hypothetical protein
LLYKTALARSSHVWCFGTRFEIIRPEANDFIKPGNLSSLESASVGAVGESKENGMNELRSETGNVEAILATADTIRVEQ